MHQLGKRQVIVGFCDYCRCEGVHRKGVSNIDIRCVCGNRIIWQNIKVVNVLTIWISFIGNFWTVVLIKNIRFVITEWHCFCHHSFIRNLKALCQWTTQVVILTVIDWVPKSYCDFHQIRAIIKRCKIDTLTVRNQSHLVFTKILKNVICIWL